MENSIEQRVVELEGMALAYGLAIKALILETVPTEQRRTEIKELLCEVMEGAYERIPDVSHDKIQRALGEMEMLFPSPDPSSER